MDEDKRTKMKGFYENLLKNNTRNPGVAGAGGQGGAVGPEKKSKQLGSLLPGGGGRLSVDLTNGVLPLKSSNPSGSTGGAQSSDIL
jgi:hypothetical protein